MTDCIYLDHAAMTRPLPCAVDAFRTAPFGNPSSEHAIGQAARDALEQARERIARCMDCEPQEIYFTATATEAAALALNSMDKSCVYIETTPLEHHAIIENIRSTSRHGNPLHFGYPHILAQNETGEVFHVEYLHEKFNADLVLLDATAAVGHVPVSFRELWCNYLIADGIKFGALPGAAFLIAKQGAPLSPLIRGGGQERGMRSGTENVPAICAMAAALEWQTEHMEENTEHISAMQMRLYEMLSEIPNHKWNTPFEQPHLPHILNVSFDGVDAKALVLLLSKEGIMVSAGAACSNGKNEPSHVLMAMFGDEARARSAIRISLSHENTLEECEIATEKIKNAVEYLRSIA